MARDAALHSGLRPRHHRAPVEGERHVGRRWHRRRVVHDGRRGDGRVPERRRAVGGSRRRSGGSSVRSPERLGGSARPPIRDPQTATRRGAAPSAGDAAPPIDRHVARGDVVPEHGARAVLPGRGGAPPPVGGARGQRAGLADHDPGAAPGSGGEPAERSHEEAHRMGGDHPGPDAHRRGLRHELPSHAGAGLEGGLPAGAGDDGGRLDGVCTSCSSGTTGCSRVPGAEGHVRGGRRRVAHGAEAGRRRRPSGSSLRGRRTKPTRSGRSTPNARTSWSCSGRSSDWWRSPRSGSPGCGSSPTGTRPGPRRWPPRSTRSGGWSREAPARAVRSPSRIARGQRSINSSTGPTRTA